MINIFSKEENHLVGVDLFPGKRLSWFIVLDYDY